MSPTIYHAGSFLKCSIDGLNKSGKSGTAARLAVGISKELCGSSPVYVSDSEERWRFYKAAIFDVEKVPLVISPGSSLIRVQENLGEAVHSKVCVFVQDQLTTPWMEAVREFSMDDGYLSFERRQQLQNQWIPVVEQFRYGQFHAIACGRLGYQWEQLEDERGRLRLTQGDSKFNAGGGQNFGYEADLEIEMSRNKRRFGLLRNRTKVEYVADVVGDAAGGVLNGRQFIFEGDEGPYKPGGYKKVFEAFLPYIQFMEKIAPPTPDNASTKELLITGKTAWAEDQSERRKLLEEIDNLMTYCLGGPQSKDGKRMRNLVLESWGFGWSWTRLEEDSALAQLREFRDQMKMFRRRVDRGEVPTDNLSLTALMELSKADIPIYPMSSTRTLLEELGRKSCEAVAKGKKTLEAVGD